MSAPRATDGVPRILEGVEVSTGRAPPLPARVCLEHLAGFGARCTTDEDHDTHDGRPSAPAGELTIRPTRRAAPGSLVEPIVCTIDWYPPRPGDPAPPAGAEVLVQATSGLMAVHGRDLGAPRRLGLEVASAAAGIVAMQGILAALLAARRGRARRRVGTSVMHAALLLLSHHLAIATSADGLTQLPTGAGPGPPFRTADGHWVEIEALGFGAWIRFWERLGAPRGELDAAWSAFVYRYLTAACTLPVSIHEAAARHSLAQIRRTAEECGVAVCRLRSYAELVDELRRERGGGAAASSAGGWVGDVPWTIRPGAARSNVAHVPSSRADAPLAGLQVVEVTSRLQGPLAGLLLHMLGATVVKVEPPGGDFGRHAPPLAGSLGAAYLTYNRGKRVVEIDYKQPGGRAGLADLAAGADVFLHNWRSGRAEELGLDFEHLAPRNPGLIYAHASGWGQSADEPCPIAGDFLVQAHGAFGDGLNPIDEPPFPSRLAMLDVTGGLLACEGILAGLCLREQCGRGCRVDTSLLGGAMTLQRDVLQSVASGRERGRRSGRPIWGPLDRPVETAAGYLALALEDERARHRLAESCGLDASAGDDAIVARLRSRSAAEWEKLLGRAGVVGAEVRTDLAGLPRDWRVAGLLERIEDACWTAAAPWRLDD